MKASPSSTSEDDEAENNDGPLVFDYADFFSVLMYYAHMSKDEIMNHSRAFLHGIYRMYAKRACENLGVSPTSEEEIGENKQETENISLLGLSYPTEFTKLPPRESKIAESNPDKTKEFLASFAGAQVFKDALVVPDDEQ